MALPTTAEVASLLRTRTTTRLDLGGGPDTGDFSASTVPTAAQVEMIIQRVDRIVRVVIGDYDTLADPTLLGAIRDVIALGAAAEVEESYQPEATAASANSIGQIRRRQFEADLKRLEMGVIEHTSGGANVAGSGLVPRATGLDAAPDAAWLDRW